MSTLRQQPFVEKIVHRFSSFSKSVRVLAYCRRFVYNIRSAKTDRQINYLLVHELQEAEILIVRSVQQLHFADDYFSLCEHGELPDNSKLLPLAPFLDEHKLLRVGGRLRNSVLPFDAKHPIVLPSKHHITNLIIDESHERTLHGGVQLTLNHLRNVFWVVNGRRIVRQRIGRCLICFRHRPKLSTQLMGDLPAHRVQPTAPFSSVGIDYAGPFNISPSKGRGRTSTKGYVSLFVCLVTKAIHLELVSDLSSDTFLAALKRFVGRRGLCVDIFSDCGTNFVGANRQLKINQKWYRTFIEEKAIPYLVEKRIQWHFIPPSSPHFGGLWEAGVKSMKTHLRKTVGDQVLTFEEFSTVLCQIESCLNSRPLCPMTNDIDDLAVLTPGHFLIQRAMLATPEPIIETKPLQQRWKNCEFLAQRFWRQWSSEYLSRLQHRPKWLKRQQNIKVDDIVLIRDERILPNQWPLGKVIEAHPGDDGLVRVATIKTRTGLFKRPIAKLCLLPITDNFDQQLLQ